MRKECSMQLNRSLMARRWGLFRNNAQAIHKHLPRTFRREDLSPVVKDNGGLTKTGPGMLTASDTDQVIFPLHTDLYQAHIVFFLEWPQSQTAPRMAPVLTQMSAAACTRLATVSPEGVTTYRSIVCSST